MRRKEVIVLVPLLAALIPCGAALRLDFGNRAKLNKSLQHAKQIGLGLRVYAADNRGDYPKGESANEALAPIVKEFESEKPFYVEGSAWHGKGNTEKRPDSLWEDSHPPGVALDAGENAWAFNTFPDDSSPASIPVLASGFSDKLGVYSKDPAKFGGVWRGKNCIVIYADGSGEVGKLDEDGKFIDGEKDVFAAGPTVKLVNPVPPKEEKGLKKGAAEEPAGPGKG